MTRTAALLLTFALAACGGEVASGPDAIITLMDGGILAPDRLAAGSLDLRVLVEGNSHHSLTLCRSSALGICEAEPVVFTFTQKPSTARDPDALPDQTRALVMGAGWDARVTTSLEPGRYRLWCSIINHAAEGMDRLVTVEVSGADAPR